MKKNKMELGEDVAEIFFYFVGCICSIGFRIFSSLALIVVFIIMYILFVGLIIFSKRKELEEIFDSMFDGGVY